MEPHVEGFRHPLDWNERKEGSGLKPNQFIVERDFEERIVDAKCLAHASGDHGVGVNRRNHPDFLIECVRCHVSRNCDVEI